MGKSWESWLRIGWGVGILRATKQNRSSDCRVKLGFVKGGGIGSGQAIIRRIESIEKGYGPRRSPKGKKVLRRPVFEGRRG